MVLKAVQGSQIWGHSAGGTGLGTVFKARTRDYVLGISMGTVRNFMHFASSDLKKGELLISDFLLLIPPQLLVYLLF